MGAFSRVLGVEKIRFDKIEMLLQPAAPNYIAQWVMPKYILSLNIKFTLGTLSQLRYGSIFILLAFSIKSLMHVSLHLIYLGNSAASGGE